MDIVTLISQDVHLTKRGKEWVGLCVFHSEKTPSFSVSLDKGLYYCFSCQRGGDQIQFLRDYRGLSFKDACKVIGKELQPDPRWERRRQLKAKIEWDYWTWRRQLWRDLLTLDADLRFELHIAETTYRSVLRAPDRWTEDEQIAAIATLGALYDRREVLNHQLDLLQSPRHEHDVQEWWKEQTHDETHRPPR